VTTSESDLKEQLEGLDWGTDAPAPEVTLLGTQTLEERGDAPTPDQGGGDSLEDLDVSVAGVKPAKPKKARARKVRVVRQPNAQALLDAAKSGQTVAANAPGSTPSVGRRGRNEAPEVLVKAGEGPAVIALFDAMWKDTGSKLARSIGRAKASRQDAAIGWYALLLAMRERDAAK